MKKVIEIKGMSCGYCQARAIKALNGIDGVDAKVDLKKNQAVVNLASDVADQVFIDALSEVDLEVVSIGEKKGLFGR